MNANFTATFLTAGHAKEFADNAERTLGATEITRKARRVEFAVEVGHEGFRQVLADARLTVHHYGTERARVTYTPNHDIEESTMATTVTTTSATNDAVVEKAVRRRGPAKTGNPETDRKANAIKAAKAAPAPNYGDGSAQREKAAARTAARTAAAKTAAPKTSRIFKPATATIQAKVPAGYVPRYAHKSYDLYSTVPGEGKIQWLVVCNAHGTHTAATGGREGDVLGSKAGRQGWCAKCKAEGATAGAKATK